MNRFMSIGIVVVIACGASASFAQETTPLPCKCEQPANCTNPGGGAGGFCSGTVSWCEGGWVDCAVGRQALAWDNRPKICYSSANGGVVAPCSWDDSSYVKSGCTRTTYEGTSCCFINKNDLVETSVNTGMIRVPALGATSECDGD